MWCHGLGEDDDNLSILFQMVVDFLGSGLSTVVREGDAVSPDLIRQSQPDLVRMAMIFALLVLRHLSVENDSGSVKAVVKRLLKAIWLLVKILSALRFFLFDL